MNFSITTIKLKKVDSTNLYAKALFNDLPDGSLILADSQTAGRGRLGREWISPPGVNVYASLVMKHVSNPFYATIVASLSVLDTLRKASPKNKFYIKWPNDIYAGAGKISGILCECVISADNKVAGIVAGMGININLSEETISSIDQPAASLKSLTKRDHNISGIVKDLCAALESNYIKYKNSPLELFSLWKSENYLIGKEVDLDSPDNTSWRGRVVDISDEGELLVENLAAGCVIKFSCGDIRIRKGSIPPLV